MCEFSPVSKPYDEILTYTYTYIPFPRWDHALSRQI